jgi:WD40 repeat protein
MRNRILMALMLTALATISLSADFAASNVVAGDRRNLSNCQSVAACDPAMANCCQPAPPEQPTGPTASDYAERTVKLWESTTGRLLQTFKGHIGGVTSVAFSPDGKRIASGAGFPNDTSDPRVMLWDTGSGKLAGTLLGHNGAVSTVAFSPGGTRLASASLDGTIKFWDPATGQVTRTINDTWATSFAFGPDGRRIASGHLNGDIKLWDITTGQALLTFKGPAPAESEIAPDPQIAVTSVAISPDGKNIVSRSRDGMVRVWDAANGRETRTFNSGSKRFYGGYVSLSPNGKRIASYGVEEQITLWETLTGEKTLALEGSSGSTFCNIAFSPDGRRIASALPDHSVKLWDASTGRETLTLKGHTTAVTSVAFSPDGTRIASGSLDLPPRPGCHPGCFPAGTAVCVPGGTRPIEKIREGEIISTIGPDGNIARATVAKVFVTRNHLVEVRTDDGVLVTTETQPLYVAAGRFQLPRDLKAGDGVWRWENGLLREVTVRTVTRTGREESVFNLVIGDSAIFISGGFLVRSKPPAERAVTGDSHSTSSETIDSR